MQTLIPISLAYIAGGFPTGVLLSRYWLGADVRALGSKNPGAVNVWRVFGLRYGLLVLVVDVWKGYFAAGLLPELFGFTSVGFGAFLGLMAVCGHIWSPWTHFRGGKGVGTAFGVVLALYPQVALICILCWGAVLLLTRYASVSSLSAAACYPATLHWRYDVSWSEFTMSIVLSLLLAYSHRHNLQRLRCGAETKIWGNS